MGPAPGVDCNCCSGCDTYTCGSWRRSNQEREREKAMEAGNKLCFHFFFFLEKTNYFPPVGFKRESITTGYFYLFTKMEADGLFGYQCELSVVMRRSKPEELKARVALFAPSQSGRNPCPDRTWDFEHAQQASVAWVRDPAKMLNPPKKVPSLFLAFGSLGKWQCNKKGSLTFDPTRHSTCQIQKMALALVACCWLAFPQKTKGSEGLRTPDGYV